MPCQRSRKQSNGMDLDKILPRGRRGMGHASTVTGLRSWGLRGWGHSIEETREEEAGLVRLEQERGEVAEGEENWDFAFCGWGIIRLWEWFWSWVLRMTRGKQKIEAQKRSAERNEKPKGSQIEARNAGLKTVCSVCKAPLANYKQLVDHFGSKHLKEAVPPAPSS